ncbi:MAG: endonuclease/exonuclease/phosphatase family protein [Bacteriovorax sp.]|jgi:endonuclease/exonuclease/phosphatase family metal-dependent hydrolase
MMPVKISFILIFILSFTCLKASESAQLNFTITTFNIKFYGYHSEQEKRDPFLQTFLKDSVPASDIIVFEEIVDVPRLKNILPSQWSCLSYPTPYEGHQHVVLCHSPRFKFMREPSDNNDVIDEVAGERGTWRPALTTIVTDTSGKKLFRIVAVHLKALPEYSKARVAQAEIIAGYLEKLKSSKLPVVVAGDFNTFKAPENNETVNDKELILNSLNSAHLDMHLVPNDLFTFRTSYGQAQFDHFFVSDAFKVNPLKIFEICNSAITNDAGNLDLALYNKNISDHCPVSAEISL